VPEGALALKPKGLGHVEAASMPSGCLTVYEAMTKVAPLGPGSRVLILGAAGGVGVFAVQFARYLGCHVVAVCRREFATQVRAFGAHEVVSPGEGVLKLSPGFDLVFDTPPVFSFRQCEPLLNPGGTYIHTLPSRDAEGFELAKTSTKKAGYLMVLSVHDDALIQVAKLIEAGVFKPAIDRVYPFDDIQAAHERFSTHGKLGRVVVDTSL
jgi:NADPH:quinone reductase-like Zn-dependent oxidoreductase